MSFSLLWNWRACIAKGLENTCKSLPSSAMYCGSVLHEARLSLSSFCAHTQSYAILVRSPHSLPKGHAELHRRWWDNEYNMPAVFLYPFWLPESCRSGSIPSPVVKQNAVIISGNGWSEALHSHWVVLLGKRGTICFRMHVLGRKPELLSKTVLLS